MLGGWASGSKYSFLGAMRAAAQLISYEVSQGLALVGVLITAGTLSLTGIVHAQQGMWYIVPQLGGFIIFMVAASPRRTARRSTSPRPTPSSSAATTPSTAAGAFSSYFAEYLNVVVVSGVATTLFLGGWMIPGWHGQWAWTDPFVVLIKMTLFVIFFIWIRATLPRLRYDQLMSFGWKVLLPLATLNLLVTAIVVVAVHK